MKAYILHILVPQYSTIDLYMAHRLLFVSGNRNLFDIRIVHLLLGVAILVFVMRVLTMLFCRSPLRLVNFLKGLARTRNRPDTVGCVVDECGDAKPTEIEPKFQYDATRDFSQTYVKKAI